MTAYGSNMKNYVLKDKRTLFLPGKYCKGFFVLMLSIAVLFLYTSRAAAIENQEKKSKISVVYCEDCIPFHFQNEDGKPDGMIIDLWRLWSQKTGIEIEYKPASWNDTLILMREGRADAHAGLFFNEERDKYLDYGSPLRKTDTHIFYDKRLPSPESNQDFKPYRIGVLSGDYVEGYLKKNLPGAAVVGYKNYEAIIEAIRRKEIRAFIQEIPLVEADLSRLGLPGALIRGKETLFSNYMHAGVWKGNDALLKKINDGFATIPFEQLAGLEAKWFPKEEDRFYKKGTGFLRLTSQEREWLSAHPVIKVHNETDWAPFNFNENSIPKGFSIDYIKAVDIIREGKRSHFDPDMVDAFLQVEEKFREIALEFADHEEEREALQGSTRS